MNESAYSSIDDAILKFVKEQGQPQLTEILYALKFEAPISDLTNRVNELVRSKKLSFNYYTFRYEIMWSERR